MKFPGISNKREHIAQTLGQLGVLGLLERVAALRQPALLVLTYHRIAERDKDRFYAPVISATPQSFRSQVKWLHNQMHILTLLELDNQIQAGGTWKEPVALVTFDDGYRDNFEVAVPILKDLKIPATFFITTGFLESPRLPWWDHIAYIVKETPRHRLELKRGPSDIHPAIVIELDGISRDDAVMPIIRAILDERITDLPWFLEHLRMKAEVTIEVESLGRALFMSWEQVRHIADCNDRLAIGSHGHSHHSLADLDMQSQQRELVVSKRILEERLGREVPAIAYPFGWTGTYTQATKMLVQKAGYRVAFASQAGVNYANRLDPFEINRLGVGSGDSATLLRARAALFSTFGRSFL